MRWLIESVETSGRFSLNLVAKSVAVVLRGIGRLTGGGFLEQMAGFVADLNDLFGGFRQRAEAVSAAFRGDEFAYIMVTTPSPAAIREALYFAERLKASGMRRDAIVVNRVNRPPPPRPTIQEVVDAERAHGLQLGAGSAQRLLEALESERARANVDAKNLQMLAEESDQAHVRVDIPALPSDVHDLGTLAGISALLCPPG